MPALMSAFSASEYSSLSCQRMMCFTIIEILLLLTEILAALIVTSAQKLRKSFYLLTQRRDDIIKGKNGNELRRSAPGTQEIFGGLRAAPISAPQDCEEHQMKKHLAHLAAALAVTLLFGAAAGPLECGCGGTHGGLSWTQENTARGREPPEPELAGHGDRVR